MDSKLSTSDDSQPDTLHSQDLDRRASISSASTTSLILEHINNGYKKEYSEPYRDDDSEDNYVHDFDIEDPKASGKAVDPKTRRWLYTLGIICLVGWSAALALFITSGSYKHRSTLEHNPDAISSQGSGKKITIDQLQTGFWSPKSHDISWIAGPNGEDGMILRVRDSDKGFAVVEDVRSLEAGNSAASDAIVLMKQQGFTTGGEYVMPQKIWPSKDLKKVLVMSDYLHNWRHSFTGRYWIFDVESQTAEPLDHARPDGRVQLATWSPKSNAVVFTRENNMFIRELDGGITQVTTDGGAEMFNGVPDWVYEEEVFSGNSVTWWSDDGKYLAFLATNESGVPEYPVEYFIQRPSLTEPKAGLEAYPEVRQIKYPKAGAPNPVVHLRFYDVNEKSLFDVPIEDDFEDDDRLITEVVWAGESGKVLIRETNRESYVLKVVLIDAEARSGNIVREQDVQALDGGWFEISETTTFIPKDPTNGRPYDGYVDTVIHEGYDHLAYFTPLNSSTPITLTSGQWEVVDAPSAIDLTNNLVYFTATKESSIQRHIYTVTLDGTMITPMTDVSTEGYHAASFSTSAGYAVLNYRGPKIPWQRVMSTPSNTVPFNHSIEENTELAQRASEYELPLKVFSTINIDGFELNVVERRPPHFDQTKRYPVLFYLYGGPGSQTVDKHFGVDFQAYVASNLGYIVVTVDGRGTGFIGREARTIVKGNLGNWEAHDQIATAQAWGKKKYVDETRMAIWGWSYGGFMTLKTLEADAGRTFRYGMAVAPVTDFRFYGKLCCPLKIWIGFLTN
jgi:dipeptidyl aminopeptidase